MMSNSERENVSSSSVQQPTVLDWFKSLLKLKPIPIPEVDEGQPEPTLADVARVDGPVGVSGVGLESIRTLTIARIRLPAALLLAFAAQLALERRAGLPGLTAMLYVVAGILFLWAFLSDDFLPSAFPSSTRREFTLDVRPRPLIGALGLSALTFLASGGNQLRLITVVAWVGAAILLFVGLWEGELRFGAWADSAWKWLKSPSLRFDFQSWHFLVVASILIVAFFRFASLDTVPYEMWSDQAEKLLDVRDVLGGETSIFFPRNSGREAIEFYLAAAVIKIFGTGLSFITLKIVTASAGFLATLLLYLFAKEIGGRRVGLLALLLAGMAFWPNITSRAGVRSPLNELAVAPALYFMLRGFRTGNRNDFLWSGLAVGLGLQGYSGARILPFAVLMGFIIHMISQRTRDSRLHSLAALTALTLVAFVGFLPLFRVLVDMPDQVLYRVLTRVGTLERPYEGSPILIFISNMWHALTMFAWDSGEIWVMTVPDRPVLDWISGVMFHLGVILAAALYWRRRRWQYLYLLLLVPLLLLTSALALAFPNENPAPARVSGAIVPAFTLAALALDSVYGWLQRQTSGRGGVLAPIIILILLLGVGLSNYRLVMDTYATRQRASAWSATEAGAVMRGFAQSIGGFDDVYIVHTPFWIDSRLIAIEAGAPIRDYSILHENIADLDLARDRYHLFFIKPEDTATVESLRQYHPGGQLSNFHSDQIGRDFLLYLVPPESSPNLTPFSDGRP
jgi:hypothetical protein